MTSYFGKQLHAMDKSKECLRELRYVTVGFLTKKQMPPKRKVVAAFVARTGITTHNHDYI